VTTAHGILRNQGVDAGKRDRAAYRVDGVRVTQLQWLNTTGRFGLSSSKTTHCALSPEWRANV
jgi:hypothetical protein